MRHLATNFSKKFRGKIFDDNLWPSSLTCNPRKHAYHLRQIYSKPKVQEYLEACHTKIWARSKFNEVCKVDYVNNNLAESFNSKLKKMVDMFDCLRQRSIFKFDLRRRIAEKLEGHRILPSVVKTLNEKTRARDPSGSFPSFKKKQRICKESVDPAFGEEGYEELEQEPEPIVVANSSSSRKGAKKVVRNNTSNKRKSPDSTNVDASATISVSLDSPAKNTRSKTTKAQDSPAKNTRNKKRLCL